MAKLPITVIMHELLKDDLLRISEALELDASPRDSVKTLQDRIRRSRPDIEAVLWALKVDDLRYLCGQFELLQSGLKEELVDRLERFLSGEESEEDEDKSEDWNEADDDDPDAESDDYDEDDDDPDADRLNADFNDRADDKPLRPYQRDAVRKVESGLKSGVPQLLHLATGGGKTRVANEVVKRWLENHAGPVLWVTKDWPLLYQASSDLSRRVIGPDRLGRIGGDTSLIRHLKERQRKHQVLYTTLHTFSSRRLSLARFKPTLVVWDECHWGESAKLGKHLLKWCKARGIALLGLTATPRDASTSDFSKAYSRSFKDLVDDGHLARPVCVPRIHTGVKWTPERLNAYSDATQESLKTLANNPTRNKKLVEHYVKNQETYGPTPVFACNIDHANKLASLFGRRGIAARPVHSQRSAEENQANIDKLRTGELQVIVNVAMLTHGIDIPSVKTVFLARPTFSPTLFAQMVGRGARLNPQTNKTSFFLVEFADQLERFGDALVNAGFLFDGALAPVSTEDKRKASRKPSGQPGHGFDSTGEPRWVPDSLSFPEEMRRLWYREGQTFGFELELTSNNFDSDMPRSDWRGPAEALRQALLRVLPSKHVATSLNAEPTHERWNVVWDGSCGWEVTTRVLKDAEGMQELIEGVDALRSAAETLGLKVNFRTGTHLHLGWLGRREDALVRVVRLVRLFEPALATLVSPSRLVSFDNADETYDVSEPNRYCRPVSSVFPERKLKKSLTVDDLAALCSDDDDRYVSFNIKPLENINTVEVRLHNGTLEPQKLLPWLSFWQQLLWIADHYDGNIPAVPDATVMHPSGDIVELLKRYFPDVVQRSFLNRLNTRRMEVAALYRKHPTLKSIAPVVRAWQRF